MTTQYMLPHHIRTTCTTDCTSWMSVHIHHKHMCSVQFNAVWYYMYSVCALCTHINVILLCGQEGWCVMVTTYIGWLLGRNLYIVQCMQYAELQYTDSTGLHYILTRCEDMFTTNNCQITLSVELSNGHGVESSEMTTQYMLSHHIRTTCTTHCTSWTSAHIHHKHVCSVQFNTVWYYIYVLYVCTVYTHQCDSAVWVGRVVCNCYYVHWLASRV